MQYGEQKWTHIPELTGQVAVLPLGSTEQHGHHLPLLTDSMIGDEIVRRVQSILEGTAVFLPMLWCGASDHHRQFPGTISLSRETYTRMLVDILECLIESGFRRILLLNSHGGNEMPGAAAAYEVQMKHRDRRDLWLVLGTWFTIAREQIAELEALEQKYVTHACELETSMMLCLRPELVDLEAARGAHAPFKSAFLNPYSSRSSYVTVRRPFDHISATGAYGHPELGTADKGAALFDLVVDRVVACIQELASWEPLEPC
jgi:creatinine amidohydrolase